MTSSFITCSVCERDFLKDNRHINENKKLGHNFYCSPQCQSSYKNKRVELTCENFSCRNKFKRVLSRRSFRNFCSQSCAATLNNTNRHKNTNYCRYCGNKCLSSRNYCSIKCWAKTHEISKDELIHQIQSLSLSLGRTPVKRECKHYTACYKYFDSWTNALIIAGLTPHRSLNQKMYKRRICRARDGHMCNSVSELIIDNWLTSHSIQHEKEAPYPKGKFTADWKISSTLVEYFGLANDSKRYDEEIEKKQQICKDAKINLIAIYSKDLFPKRKLTQIFQGLQKI